MAGDNVAAKRFKLNEADDDGLPRCSLANQEKCCVDLCDSPAGHIYDTLKPHSRRAYECLSALTPLLDHNSNPETFMKINPIRVTNNNAVDGASFSEAYCSVDLYPDAYSIALIFQKGIGILLDYIIDSRKPADNKQAHVLEVLLHFLDQNYFTKPWSDNLTEALNGKTHTDKTVFLTNHLFGQLSLTPKYVIDGQSKGRRDRRDCSCPKTGCKMTGIFGDTSIGNSEVWYGKVDVLLNHIDTTIKVVKKEEENDDNDDSTTEINKHTSSTREKDQIFAETIVFSFLQKQLHPYRRNHLYPCIVVNGNTVVVYFYDSQHDVLLASSTEPLFDQKTGHFQLATIVLLWLVVNHKCLSSGLTSDLACKKSGFFGCKKLEVFRVGLYCGRVVSPVKSVRKFSQVNEPGIEVENLNKRRLNDMSGNRFT